MGLFGPKKKELGDFDREQLEKERQLLANIQRGTVIGDFIVACKTDYVQSFSDTWIARFDYKWSEYLMLTKDLLEKPEDLTALVYLPQDLSEVYYIVVPPQSPNHTHLSQQGRQDYELAPSYEAAVDAALHKDYASLPSRSVFHSVDPQGGTWQHVVTDVLSGRKQTVVLEYNGSRYNYYLPKDPKEAEASAFTALATRRGHYPMEESLLADRKFDLVPALPNGVTGRVTVRTFSGDPKEKPPFPLVSFQQTEIPADKVQPDHPATMYELTLGTELGPDDSLAEHLAIKYVQLNIKNPTVKIAGYY